MSSFLMSSWVMSVGNTSELVSGSEIEKTLGTVLLTLRVLCGDDDGVDTGGDGATALHLVLASDLGLAIGADPWAGSVLAHLSKAGSE